MNPIKKIYCRTFQAALKLAIPILPYRDPEILQSVSGIPKILKREKIDRVLIVTDESLHRLGLLDELKRVLGENNIKFFVYDETVPNPTVKNVEDAKKIYLNNRCKGLIGFGGGSPIDCAKAAGARIVRPKKTISKMRGILKILHSIPFMIAIPTTAGTGSETTVTTVITDEKTRRKYAISDFALIPNVAVHDPEITKTLPLAITAATGMDALTHAVEAYIGRSTVKTTRKDALDAAKLIAENLEYAYNNGSDLEARANMLKASYLAGRAFSKSYVGYCHAVAHTLGGQYNIPHGLANAVLLPYVLECYGAVIYKKLKDFAVVMNLAQDTDSAEAAAKKFIEYIKEINRNMGIPDKLEGIKEADIPELSKIAEKEANPLYPVPVLMTAKELERLYYMVMKK